MSDTILAAFIAAIPATAVATMGLIKARKIREDVHKVHLEINSRLDEMLALTRKSSHAEGMKQEKDNPSSPPPHG